MMDHDITRTGLDPASAIYIYVLNANYFRAQNLAAYIESDIAILYLCMKGIA